jgi:hypothetical protein
MDEEALWKQHRKDGNQGLARICLTYTVRFFRAGGTAASRDQVGRKLGEVLANEQFAGVWNWIIAIGYELGPDQSPQVVGDGESTTPHRQEEFKPVWDKCKRVLTYAGRRLREYRDSAETQIAILDTFQELDWTEVVYSPFPANKQGRDQLKNAIKNLNGGLKQPAVIEFSGDGTGTQVRWRRM